MLIVSLVRGGAARRDPVRVVERAIPAAGLPPSFLGVVIAVARPAAESVAAVKAAYANRVQTSLNLAIGSAHRQHRPDHSGRRRRKEDETAMAPLSTKSRAASRTL